MQYFYFVPAKYGVWTLGKWPPTDKETLQYFY